MSTKVGVWVVPRADVGRRWTNEVALVLFGYLLLGLLVVLGDGSLLQIALASVLALFGSGYSLVTALFPRRAGMDAVERVALAGGLSLAVGGLLGFVLARSPWGLRASSFLQATFLFNLGCYGIVWYRQREFGTRDLPPLSWHPRLSLPGWSDPNPGSRLVTAALVIFLVSGGWALYQALLRPSVDPPMTEFFLLDPNGKVEDYPQIGAAGDLLLVNFGVVNRQEEAGLFEVRALANGDWVGSSQTFRLDPGQAKEDRIELRLPGEAIGQTKIEFKLFCGDELCRSLYLWLDVAKAKE